MTREFQHYEGCRYKDPDNCSGCALDPMQSGEEGPNYAGWPLCFIENGRAMPSKWFRAFLRHIASDNKAYGDNIVQKVEKHGVRFY